MLLGVALPAVQAFGQGRTHFVRGRVVDVLTGAPVSGAEVLVLGRERSAVTNGTGYFRHSGLAAAPHLLQVSKVGYVTMTWEVPAVDDTAVVYLLELQPQKIPVGEQAAQSSGQEGTRVVQGRVVERLTGTPVADAAVLVLGRRRPQVTDRTGHFRHAGLAATSHVIQVSKLGYDTMAWEVSAADDSTLVHVLEVQRSEVPVMAPVVIEAVPGESTSYWHADFERRRALGDGQFVTRQEIVRRNAASLGDLLRTLNGVRMQCDRRGCSVRMTRSNCRPTYFIDGFPTDPTTVERMPVNDLFGVEVYDISEVPIAFQRTELRCGVIAAWTRRGPAPR